MTEHANQSRSRLCTWRNLACRICAHQRHFEFATSQPVLGALRDQCSQFYLDPHLGICRLSRRHSTLPYCSQTAHQRDESERRQTYNVIPPDSLRSTARLFDYMDTTFDEYSLLIRKAIGILHQASLG